MKRLICASVVCGLTFLPMPAPAVSLSGIVLYAAHYDGYPNGDTDQTRLVAFLWHTAPSQEWFGLGVWPSLPPGSLRMQPLNAPNFMLEYPLADGENDFTLLGEPPGTTDATYTHYVVDLFFDSAISGPPGMSVLFPRNNPMDGTSITPNPSAFIYNLALQNLDAQPPPTVYDDGISRVSIVGASFLPPDRYSSEPEGQPNLMVGHAFAPNGAATGIANEKDMIGVLRVMVEASTTDSAGAPLGGAGVPAPMAPDSGRAAGGLGGPAVGGYPGNVGAGLGAAAGAGAAAGQQPNAGYGQQAQHVQPTAPIAPTPQVTQADTEPTSGADESPTGGPTPEIGTGTPAKTHGTTPPTTPAHTTPTAPAHTTPTPKPTFAAGAHLPPGTRLGGTPTAAAVHVQGTPHATGGTHH